MWGRSLTRRSFALGIRIGLPRRVRRGTRRPEHMDAAVVDELVDDAALREDVEVPDHLPDREHRLRLGGLVVPDAPRDLEGRAAAAVEGGRDELEAPLVECEPLGDQRAVVVDHGPVTGQQHGGAASPRFARALPDTARALAARTCCDGSWGTTSAPEVISERRWSPTIAIAVRLVDEERVGGAVPRTLDDPEQAAARPDEASVGEDVGRREVRAVPDDVLQNGSLASIMSVGTPCAARRRRPKWPSRVARS